MAITWEVTIKSLDDMSYRASITGTATDSANPDNPITVTVADAVIETVPQQGSALDILYAKYQKALTRQTQVAAFLAGKEAAAKTNLEARQ